MSSTKEMEKSEFVFLNATGSSSLAAPIARQMRAHITRANFAKRRQRLNKDPMSKLVARKPRPNPDSNIGNLAFGKTAANFPSSELDTIENGEAFHDLQGFVFLRGKHLPDTPNEAAWFNLIATDPALMEASMAVAIRHWSPETTWQIKAHRHSYIAFNLINSRLMSMTNRSDGVLAAVITMAFGASLERDEKARNVHISGLISIIQERNIHTSEPIPSWLPDLVVQDSVNAIFSFPRIYQEHLLKTLCVSRPDKRLSKIGAIADRIIHLQKLINSHHNHHFDTGFIAREIEEPLADLHYELRSLRTIKDAYVQSTAIAMELALYILWPSQSAAHLTLLAEELSHAIRMSPIKGCSYMNITSFQLLIGAISAERGSAARTWFMDCLSNETRAMQLRGWDEPLSLLQSSNIHAGILKDAVVTICDEIYSLAKDTTN